ncbi:MAG: tetratricopeptide repeat protein [Trichloromonadaceae bacterium]
MYNLLISFFLSTTVAVLLHTLAGLDLWIATLVSVLVFMGAYFLLTRYFMKKVGELMESAQRDIQAGRVDKAVKTLQEGYRYGKWQIYVKSNIDAQIGTILYLKRDFSAAFDYLQKGFVRQWVAMGMLGICYMKRNKPGKMIETFDKATAAAKKEPLLWNLYAFCLDHVGEKQKAIAVMEKGLKKTKDHPQLKANLELLKEGKKMRMLDYGDIWYQFHLEKQGTLVKQQTKLMQGRRKIVRR